MLAPVGSSCFEATVSASVCLLTVDFDGADFSAAAFGAALLVVLLALGFEAAVLAAVVLLEVDFLAVDLLAVDLVAAAVLAAGFFVAVDPVFRVVRRAVVFFVVEEAAFLVPSVSSLMLILINTKGLICIWEASRRASRGRGLGPWKFSAHHF